MHKEEWVGAVFTQATKKGATNGWVAGTLSFDAIHYNHPRSGDILIATYWNDQKNNKGFAGTGYSTGVAGHGGSSTYEINIALLAKGPDFKKKIHSDLPTSNVDIVPTVLGLYNFTIPTQMDGRVVSEFLINKKPTKTIKVKTQLLKTKVSYPWGSYELEVERSMFADRAYVNYAKAIRTAK